MVSSDQTAIDHACSAVALQAGDVLIRSHYWKDIPSPAACRPPWLASVVDVAGEDSDEGQRQGDRQSDR